MVKVFVMLTSFKAFGLVVRLMLVFLASKMIHQDPSFVILAKQTLDYYIYPYYNSVWITCGLKSNLFSETRD